MQLQLFSALALLCAPAPAGECLAVGCADGKVFGIKL